MSGKQLQDARVNSAAHPNGNLVCVCVRELQVKSVKTGSVFWTIGCCLSYFYMVRAHTLKNTNYSWHFRHWAQSSQKILLFFSDCCLEHTRPVFGEKKVCSWRWCGCTKNHHSQVMLPSWWFHTYCLFCCVSWWIIDLKSLQVFVWIQQWPEATAQTWVVQV